ncbi:MAG: DUF1501 domain-containing protein, partial [Planctomycetales bacterium]
MFQLDTEIQRDPGQLARRDFIRIGSFSAAGGIALGDLLRARAAASPDAKPPQAKACIVLWMSGGLSHMDTFDLKPESPDTHRGLFRPIETVAPGMLISEHLPMLAQQADKFSVLRGLTHPSPSHDTASHIMLTGNVPARGTINPSYGSVIFKERGFSGSIPPYVAARTGSRYAQAGLLGGAYKPFAVGSDPNSSSFSVRNLSLPRRLTVERLENRRKILGAIDSLKEDLDDPQFGVLDGFHRRSYDMITSPEATKAFDMNDEDAKTRDR